MKRILLLCSLLLLFLCSCLPRVVEEKIRYKKLSPYKVKRIIKELRPEKQGITSWTELESPLRKTLEYINKKNYKNLSLPGLSISTRDLKESIKLLIKVLPRLDNDPYLLEKDFDWFELTPSTFFTGYFEMDIEASLTKEGEYKYPIYGVPSDLKRANLGKFHPRWKGQTLIYRIEGDKIAPYYTRKEIDKYMAIKDKARVLAWAKNPVDIFFLQIQGSGRLILPDGTFKLIGYAGKNGRQYVSIGKYLIKNGYITREQGTLDGIINYLKDHLELVPEILYQNPSYVFFRFIEDGPVGAIGVKLTPLVSLATDPKIIPLGAIGIYEVGLPSNQNKEIKTKGIFMAQDVGGAIVDNHVDLFLGFGENARRVAGSLSNYGKVYLLIKKHKDNP